MTSTVIPSKVRDLVNHSYGSPQVIGVAANYHSALAAGAAVPHKPNCFFKSPSSIIFPPQEIQLPANISWVFDSAVRNCVYKGVTHYYSVIIIVWWKGWKKGLSWPFSTLDGVDLHIVDAFNHGGRWGVLVWNFLSPRFKTIESSEKCFW